MSPKLRNFITTAPLLFMGISAFAGKEAPPPPGRTPLPGLIAPIDDHLPLLLIGGLLLGAYYMYKIKMKQASSPQ